MFAPSLRAMTEGRRASYQPAFVAKKSFLDMAAGGEAPQLAPGSDNAMTRNEERHRIAAASLTHRPSCPRHPEPSGDLPIGGCLTGANLPKASPDPELKRCSLQVHRMIEGAKLAGEVSLEGENGRGHWAAIFLYVGRAVMLVKVSEYAGKLLSPEELATAEPLLRSRQEESSPGRDHPRVMDCLFHQVTFLLTR